MADGTTITIDAQDTGFSRSGTTTQSIQYTATTTPSVVSAFPSFFPVTKPGFTAGARAGLTNLAEIYNFGPFDTTFETSTNDLYTRSFNIAIAVAQSGPVNVRGGTARMGFELAELSTQMSINRYQEVWKNQVAWAEKVIAAVATTNTAIEQFDREFLTDNEQAIMAEHANATSANEFYGQINAYNEANIQAFTAARHYGLVGMRTDESLTGSGVQNGSVSGFGMSSWR